MKIPRKINPQRAVDQWNANVSVGGAVDYSTDRGEVIRTTTRTIAEVLSGHTAVVWLTDVRGCIALTHVKPVKGPGRCDS